jgi:1-acyl-sn-glycerol-3-phosphate acyltransferase/nucleoside-diphosphate-sugar epimerase
VLLAAPEDGLTAAVRGALAARPGVALAGAGAGEEAVDVAVFGPPRDPARPARPDLEAARTGLAGLARRRPGRLVLLSSAAALAPHHHNPGYVAEDFRSAADNPVAAAWSRLEELAAEAFAAAERIVLRPAPVAVRGGGDPVARVLDGRFAVAPPGYDPALQLLAPEDLAAAVCAAVERGGGRPGVSLVAPRGAIPLRAALRLAGTRRLPVGWSAAAGERGYLRHNWTVSGAAAERALGFVPLRSSAEAVAAAFGDGAAAAVEHDDFGLDTAYIGRYERTLFRFLHDLYWRIEVRGTEHLPRRGGAVLTGVHRGFMPWDAVMALVAVRRAVGRTPRFLIHPCLVKPPYLADYMTKLGGIVACGANADRVLGRGELLGMFPEGIRGAFTPYRRAYRLGKFGRDEYVRMALRNGAPIVPFVTVGSAEIYPIWGRLDWQWVKRATEWLYLPLAPNFPFPGLPLPSKWHTRFLAPLPVGERWGPEAADDPETVRAISREVRSRVRAALDEMLARRRSIFWGSVFEERPAGRIQPVTADRR